MNKVDPGGFEEMIAQVNQMDQGPIASPFGVPHQVVGQGQRVPIQQTTQVFYLPRDATAYDALYNETLWAGRGKVRFELRTWTKEGEVAVAVCHYTDAQPPRPPQAEPGGGGAEEVEVRPYRIP
jgi:hypothetical protein